MQTQEWHMVISILKAAVYWLGMSNLFKLWLILWPRFLSTFSFLTLLLSIVGQFLLVILFLWEKILNGNVQIYSQMFVFIVIVAALGLIYGITCKIVKNPLLPPQKKKKQFFFLCCCSYNMYSQGTNGVVCSYLHLFQSCTGGLSFIAFCGQSNTFTLLWVYYNKVDSFIFDSVTWCDTACDNVGQKCRNTFARLTSVSCLYLVYLQICDIWIITSILY